MVALVLPFTDVWACVTEELTKNIKVTAKNSVASFFIVLNFIGLRNQFCESYQLSRSKSSSVIKFQPSLFLYYLVHRNILFRMKATILTIGDELLIGQVIDTNSSWIAQQLSTIGMDVYRRISVGDNEQDIID